MKGRSARTRVKVGRLEPGDLWGMQHLHGRAEADVEIVAVEGCEVRACHDAIKHFNLWSL